MNRIYRVIWSQVRGAYVVVSEIAKSHTRGSKSFVSNSAKASVKVGLAAMVLTCGSGLISGVDAAPNRGLSLAPGEGHNDGGFTYLYPGQNSPYIQMYDYKTPGNPGGGYLYTNNKIRYSASKSVTMRMHVLMMAPYPVFLSVTIPNLVRWVSV